MMTTTLSSRCRRPLARVALLGALVPLVACGGDMSPTAPQAGFLHLTDAQVTISGESVNGMTLVQGQLTGNSTMFQARLRDAAGDPATGQAVQMRFERPGHGMMGGSGVLTLWDDGTHGDPVAGDGIYCLVDFDGNYGLHHDDCPVGPYHYEFWGVDHADRHSNHMNVSVTVTR